MITWAENLTSLKTHCLITVSMSSINKPINPGVNPKTIDHHTPPNEVYRGEKRNPCKDYVTNQIILGSSMACLVKKSKNPGKCQARRQITHSGGKRNAVHHHRNTLSKQAVFLLEHIFLF